jgi:predicted dehydrogenase
VKHEERLLRIGVLGCGPIAQIAHFDAIGKSRNAELYAICDRASDLRERMAAIHQPRVAYQDFDQMLADPQVEAIIVATADQFHVALCQKAIAAGKHVLVEKPLGVSVEECELLRGQVRQSGLVLQVGYNKRFDPGLAYARRFIQDELGQRLALKAWYCDSVYRYTMTDNLQPIPLASPQALRPEGNPKADKRRYLMLTHGSHLVDTARFLGGEIVGVQARLVEKFGAYCWFVSLDFADGSVGHLDMIIAVRDDWREGFQVDGENGSVKGKMHLPWYHKTSEVECFSVKDGVYRRPQGEDAHTYKLQIEGFADAILNRSVQHGANVDDGAEGFRALVAISRSVESGERVRLADVSGGVA